METKSKSTNIIPQKPQSFGEIICTGWAYCCKAYTRILPVSFLYSLVSDVPSLIFPSHPIRTAGNGAIDTDQLVQHANEYHAMGWWGVVLSLVIASLTLILYAAFVYQLNSIVEGRNASLGESVGRGSSKLLSLWGLSIMYGIFIIIGLILLIIPGIYVSFLLYYAFYVLILRDLGVFASFGRCRELMRGHWWRTFFLMIGLGIAMVILSVLITIPLLAFDLPRVIALLILQTLVLPVVVGILLANYLDLEKRFALNPVPKK